VHLNGQIRGAIGLVQDLDQRTALSTNKGISSAFILSVLLAAILTFVVLVAGGDAEQEAERNPSEPHLCNKRLLQASPMQQNGCSSISAKQQPPAIQNKPTATQTPGPQEVHERNFGGSSSSSCVGILGAISVIKDSSYYIKV
jgi:hypothetical protein